MGIVMAAMQLWKVLLDFRNYKAAVCISAPTDINEIIDYYDDQDNKFSYEFWKCTIGNPDDEDDILKLFPLLTILAKSNGQFFLFM